jgi:hypothetical protein
VFVFKENKKEGKKKEKNFKEGPGGLAKERKKRRRVTCF